MKTSNKSYLHELCHELRQHSTQCRNEEEGVPRTNAPLHATRVRVRVRVRGNVRVGRERERQRERDADWRWWCCWCRWLLLLTLAPMLGLTLTLTLTAEQQALTMTGMLMCAVYVYVSICVDLYVFSIWPFAGIVVPVPALCRSLSAGTGFQKIFGTGFGTGWHRAGTGRAKSFGTERAKKFKNFIW